jgi:hypothetical protein
MTEKQIRDYWDENSKYYQEDSKIGIGIHYGPGAPFEDKLKLLGRLKGKKVIEIGCGGCSMWNSNGQTRSKSYRNRSI